MVLKFLPNIPKFIYYDAYNIIGDGHEGGEVGKNGPKDI